MKKGQLLNSTICRVLGQLGHTDCIAIADAGLPIPNDVERVDIALTRGIPSFMEVFAVIGKEMQIERVILAEEVKETSSELHRELCEEIAEIAKQQENSILIEYVAHNSFKKATKDCKAIIRTGECTPYANIIVYAGVPF